MAKKKFSGVSTETANALSAAFGSDAHTDELAPKAVPLTASKGGLRGVPISAEITLISPVNPKRKGCAAEVRFSLYKPGMTQEEFLDAGGTTADMAYDTAHGFISVDGYTPPKMFEAKVREPKAPKEPKAAKEPKAPKMKKEKSIDQVELEQATEVEMID